jgi:uncharacterized membrane protein (DUF2068 family)
MTISNHPPASGTDHAPVSAPSVNAHNGLIWIGLLKLSKSLLFLAIGIGAVRMLHRDIADTILDLADKLHFEAENRFVSILINQTAVLSEPRLREISFATFCYSALAMVEAVGLLLQKEWAEYFTTILTASFLPLEIYEIYLNSTPWKWALVISNLVILLYLLWVLRENHREP